MLRLSTWRLSRRAGRSGVQLSKSTVGQFDDNESERTARLYVTKMVLAGSLRQDCY